MLRSTPEGRTLLDYAAARLTRQIVNQGDPSAPNSNSPPATSLPSASNQGSELPGNMSTPNSEEPPQPSAKRQKFRMPWGDNANGDSGGVGSGSSGGAGTGNGDVNISNEPPPAEHDHRTYHEVANPSQGNDRTSSAHRNVEDERPSKRLKDNSIDSALFESMSLPNVM